jgi:antitoxin component YwqK of YwqJK toxin-antitoxin module
MSPEYSSQKASEPVFSLTAVWVFYDQAGDTTEKISYLLGKRNGYSLKYKKDPVHGIYIFSSELYAGDRKEGLAKIFFPDGKLKQTIPYVTARRTGFRANMTMMENHYSSGIQQ